MKLIQNVVAALIFFSSMPLLGDIGEVSDAAIMGADYPLMCLPRAMSEARVRDFSVSATCEQNGDQGYLLTCTPTNIEGAQTYTWNSEGVVVGTRFIYDFKKFCEANCTEGICRSNQRSETCPTEQITISFPVMDGPIADPFSINGGTPGDECPSPRDQESECFMTLSGRIKAYGSVKVPIVEPIPMAGMDERGRPLKWYCE